MAQAYVAQPTVVSVRFTKIAEQLSTTADMVIGGIRNDSMDALLKLSQTLLVDGR